MKSKCANMVPFATLDGTIKTETTETIVKKSMQIDSLN